MSALAAASCDAVSTTNYQRRAPNDVGIPLDADTGGSPRSQSAEPSCPATPKDGSLVAMLTPEGELVTVHPQGRGWDVRATAVPVTTSQLSDSTHQINIGCQRKSSTEAVHRVNAKVSTIH